MRKIINFIVLILFFTTLLSNYSYSNKYRKESDKLKLISTLQTGTADYFVFKNLHEIIQETSDKKGLELVKEIEDAYYNLENSVDTIEKIVTDRVEAADLIESNITLKLKDYEDIQIKIFVDKEIGIINDPVSDEIRELCSKLKGENEYIYLRILEKRLKKYYSYSPKDRLDYEDKHLMFLILKVIESKIKALEEHEFSEAETKLFYEYLEILDLVMLHLLDEKFAHELLDSIEDRLKLLSYVLSRSFSDKIKTKKREEKDYYKVKVDMILAELKQSKVMDFSVEKKDLSITFLWGKRQQTDTDHRILDLIKQKIGSSNEKIYLGMLIDYIENKVIIQGNSKEANNLIIKFLEEIVLGDNNYEEAFKKEIIYQLSGLCKKFIEKVADIQNKKLEEQDKRIKLNPYLKGLFFIKKSLRRIPYSTKPSIRTAAVGVMCDMLIEYEKYLPGCAEASRLEKFLKKNFKKKANLSKKGRGIYEQKLIKLEKLRNRRKKRGIDEKRVKDNASLKADLFDRRRLDKIRDRIDVIEKRDNIFRNVDPQIIKVTKRFVDKEFWDRLEEDRYFEEHYIRNIVPLIEALIGLEFDRKYKKLVITDIYKELIKPIYTLKEELERAGCKDIEYKKIIGSFKNLKSLSRVLEARINKFDVFIEYEKGLVRLMNQIDEDNILYMTEKCRDYISEYINYISTKKDIDLEKLPNVLKRFFQRYMNKNLKEKLEDIMAEEEFDNKTEEKIKETIRELVPQDFFFPGTIGGAARYLVNKGCVKIIRINRIEYIVKLSESRPEIDFEDDWMLYPEEKKFHSRHVFLFGTFNKYGRAKLDYFMCDPKLLEKINTFKNKYSHLKEWPKDENRVNIIEKDRQAFEKFTGLEGLTTAQFLHYLSDAYKNEDIGRLSDLYKKSHNVKNPSASDPDFLDKLINLHRNIFKDKTTPTLSRITELKRIQDTYRDSELFNRIDDFVDAKHDNYRNSLFFFALEQADEDTIKILLAQGLSFNIIGRGILIYFLKIKKKLVQDDIGFDILELLILSLSAESLDYFDKQLKKEIEKIIVSLYAEEVELLRKKRKEFDPIADFDYLKILRQLKDIFGATVKIGNKVISILDLQESVISSSKIPGDIIFLALDTIDRMLEEYCKDREDSLLDELFKFYFSMKHMWRQGLTVTEEGDNCVFTVTVGTDDGEQRIHRVEFTKQGRIVRNETHTKINEICEKLNGLDSIHKEKKERRCLKKLKTEFKKCKDSNFHNKDISFLVLETAANKMKDFKNPEARWTSRLVDEYLRLVSLVLKRIEPADCSSEKANINLRSIIKTLEFLLRKRKFKPYMKSRILIGLNKIYNKIRLNYKDLSQLDKIIESNLMTDDKGFNDYQRSKFLRWLGTLIIKQEEGSQKFEKRKLKIIRKMIKIQISMLVQNKLHSITSCEIIDNLLHLYDNITLTDEDINNLKFIKFKLMNQASGFNEKEKIERLDGIALLVIKEGDYKKKETELIRRDMCIEIICIWEEKIRSFNDPEIRNKASDKITMFNKRINIAGLFKVLKEASIQTKAGDAQIDIIKVNLKPYEKEYLAKKRRYNRNKKPRKLKISRGIRKIVEGLTDKRYLKRIKKDIYHRENFVINILPQIEELMKRKMDKEGKLIIHESYEELVEPITRLREELTHVGFYNLKDNRIIKVFSLSHKLKLLRRANNIISALKIVDTGIKNIFKELVINLYDTPDKTTATLEELKALGAAV